MRSSTAIDQMVGQSDVKAQAVIGRALFFMLRLDKDIYGGTHSLLLLLEQQRTIEPFVVVGTSSVTDGALSELERRGIPHELMLLPELLTDSRRKSFGEKIRKLWQLVGCNRQFVRVIQTHDPDIVHADAEGFFMIGPAAKWCRRKLVHHLRGVQPTGTVRWTRQLAMVMADFNIAISESLRDFYKRGCNSLIRARVGPKLVCVYNGIPLAAIRHYAAVRAREQARRELGIPPAEIAVGVIGGIFPAKGQKPFLESVAPRVAKQDERVRFYIIGGVKDQPYMAECKAAVQDHGMQERVVFTGYRSDLLKWYRALDVVAFPSVREGFGRVAAEAQAFGVPVVASNIIGVRDAVAHGVGGFLADSLEEFIRYLVQLVHDVTLREDMGRQGKEYVQRFDVEKVTGDLEGLYATLLS